MSTKIHCQKDGQPAHAAAAEVQSSLWNIGMEVTPENDYDDDDEMEEQDIAELSIDSLDVDVGQFEMGDIIDAFNLS